MERGLLFGGLCFITDRRYSERPLEDIVKEVLDAGVSWVQYREKSLPRRDVYTTAERLRRLTHQYRAVFVVNDYVDIAMAVEADGVHLGQEDFPLKEARTLMGSKVIGISTHNMVQATEAASAGADYIGFGPVFTTTTKDKAESPKGISMLGRVVASIDIPVVAIGGIRLENLREVLQTGVHAVAVVSGILDSPDIYRRASEFVKILKEFKR